MSSCVSTLTFHQLEEVAVTHVLEVDHMKREAPKQVQEYEQALRHKETQLNMVLGQLATARSDLDRARKSAKFDLVAAEGRTKKIGILEHTVTTLRHELHTNMERGQKIEEKMATLERSWQNERSLRLQDLHRHDAMSSDRKHAEKQAEDTACKWLEAEKRGQHLEEAIETTVTELESQRRINAAQAGEIDAQAAEIAMYRTEVFDVKRALLSKEGEISVERSCTSNLRHELSRVRREFIVSTSKRSEQQSALLGNRRRRTSSRRHRCCALRNSVRPALSRVDLRALKQARDKVSWDDVFMPRVDPFVKAHEFHSSSICMSGGGGSTCTGGSSSRGLNEKHDPPSNHLGRERRGNGSGTAESSPLTKSKSGVSSTLRVAGSLFVGNGLGLKKDPIAVSTGGSARQILKKIIDDHLSLSAGV